MEESRRIRYQCTSCGRVIDTADGLPEGWQLPAGAELPSALDTELVSVTLRGYCSPRCARESWRVKGGADGT